MGTQSRCGFFAVGVARQHLLLLDHAVVHAFRFHQALMIACVGALRPPCAIITPHRIPRRLHPVQRRYGRHSARSTAGVQSLCTCGLVRPCRVPPVRAFHSPCPRRLSPRRAAVYVADVTVHVQSRFVASDRPIIVCHDRRRVFRSPMCGWVCCRRFCLTHLWQTGDKRVNVRCLGGVDHACKRHIDQAVLDVFEYARVEQCRFLEILCLPLDACNPAHLCHQRHVRAHVLYLQCFVHILVNVLHAAGSTLLKHQHSSCATHNRAVGGVVEAFHQRYHRTLATTGRTDERQ